MDIIFIITPLQKLFISLISQVGFFFFMCCTDAIYRADASVRCKNFVDLSSLSVDSK